jgi:hypothetical protein
MDKLVTDRATRPASSEHRFVPIETLLADPTIAGLNPEQHRLPFPATSSNTHKGRSIAGRLTEIQATELSLREAKRSGIAVADESIVLDDQFPKLRDHTPSPRLCSIISAARGAPPPA